MTTMEIKDERAEHSRYSAYLDGRRIGFASCIQLRDTVLLPHVEVDVDRRDLGVGSMLVRRAMDDARLEGHTVLPLCPFARRWAELHPAYRDVARRPKAGELGAVDSLVAADRTMRLLHHDEPKFLSTLDLQPDVTPSPTAGAPAVAWQPEPGPGR